MADARENQKRRMVLNQKKKKVISKAKACTILHEGEVHGKKLTEKARKFMGARCSGQPVKGG